MSWNPGTWFDWLGSMGSTMGGGALASVILTAEAGLFVGMLAISVWLFRLAAKSVWLTFFATLARPFVDAIFIVIAKAGLLLWLLPIAVFAGGWVAMIKGAGARGWMMILSAFLVAILGIALMSDPVTLMYGEHGLLAIARGAAFQVAEAAVHNGPSSSQTPQRRHTAGRVHRRPHHRNRPQAVSAVAVRPRPRRPTATPRGPRP